MRTVQIELRFPAHCVKRDYVTQEGCLAVRVVLVEEHVVDEGCLTTVGGDAYTAKAGNVELTIVKDTLLRSYTVVGVYAEDLEDRFADHVEAVNADAAEDQVLAAREGAVVCGVLEGHLACVDGGGR